MTPIILSPYEVGELNLSSKTGAKLYTDRAKNLPTKFTGEDGDFRLFIKDVASHVVKECCWNASILEFTADGEILNLLKDHKKLPMKKITNARNLRDATAPTTTWEVRPHTNSMMMFKVQVH
jgi:hypothetical protein